MDQTDKSPFEMKASELRVPKTAEGESLQLHQDEVMQIADHFNKFSQGKGCEVCGENSWYPLSILATGTIFDLVKNRHDHGHVVPFVYVSCNNCGNTKQFFAGHLGWTTPGHSNDPGKKK